MTAEVTNINIYKSHQIFAPPPALDLQGIPPGYVGCRQQSCKKTDWWHRDFPEVGQVKRRDLLYSESPLVAKASTSPNPSLRQAVGVIEVVFRALFLGFRQMSKIIGPQKTQKPYVNQRIFRF